MASSAPLLPLVPMKKLFTEFEPIQIDSNIDAIHERMFSFSTAQIDQMSSFDPTVDEPKNALSDTYSVLRKYQQNIYDNVSNGSWFDQFYITVRVLNRYKVIANILKSTLNVEYNEVGGDEYVRYLQMWMYLLCEWLKQGLFLPTTQDIYSISRVSPKMLQSPTQIDSVVKWVVNASHQISPNRNYKIVPISFKKEVINDESSIVRKEEVEKDDDDASSVSSGKADSESSLSFPQGEGKEEMGEQTKFTFSVDDEDEDRYPRIMIKMTKDEEASLDDDGWTSNDDKEEEEKTTPVFTTRLDVDEHGKNIIRVSLYEEEEEEEEDEEDMKSRLGRKGSLEETIYYENVPLPQMKLRIHDDDSDDDDEEKLLPSQQTSVADLISFATDDEEEEGMDALLRKNLERTTFERTTFGSNMGVDTFDFTRKHEPSPSPSFLGGGSTSAGTGGDVFNFTGYSKSLLKPYTGDDTPSTTTTSPVLPLMSTSSTGTAVASSGATVTTTSSSKGGTVTPSPGLTPGLGQPQPPPSGGSITSAGLTPGTNTSSPSLTPGASSAGQTQQQQPPPSGGSSKSPLPGASTAVTSATSTSLPSVTSTSLPSVTSTSLPSVISTSLLLPGSSGTTAGGTSTATPPIGSSSSSTAVTTTTSVLTTQPSTAGSTASTSIPGVTSTPKTTPAPGGGTTKTSPPIGSTPPPGPAKSTGSTTSTPTSTVTSKPTTTPAKAAAVTSTVTATTAAGTTAGTMASAGMGGGGAPGPSAPPPGGHPPSAPVPPPIMKIAVRPSKPPAPKVPAKPSAGFGTRPLVPPLSHTLPKTTRKHEFTERRHNIYYNIPYLDAANRYPYTDMYGVQSRKF